MLTISRRGLLGIFAAGVSAAIVRPGLIMPIKPALVPAPTVSFPRAGEMWFINSANVPERINMETLDLVGEMSRAVAGDRGGRSRFLADADASYWFDREMAARKMLIWAHSPEPGAIVRTFRGVPVAHLPSRPEGMPPSLVVAGHSVTGNTTRVRILGAFETRNRLA